MCRAVWAIVVGSSDDACRELRRAAGLEVQVIQQTSSAEEALALVGEVRADMFVIDGRAGGAVELAAVIRRRTPEVAIVWVGEEAPETAHDAIGYDDALGDSLPQAVTRALLARRV